MRIWLAGTADDLDYMGMMQAVGVLAVIFFLEVGIGLLLWAESGRRQFMSYYERYPRFYRSFPFSDWIAGYPRFHIWMMRGCGIVAIWVGVLFMLATGCS